MFFLYHGNRLEDLLDRLVELSLDPPADPLQPETVVVQNPGMARWVMQQIALRTGIGANFEFPLPARFIHRIFAARLPDLPPDAEMNRDLLLWRIFFLLPEIIDEPGFGEPRQYLTHDIDGRRRYQLAARISDLFDQYLVYRPEMLAQWEDGRDRGWQAQLWRLLTARGEYHRGRRFREFFRLRDREGLSHGDLPPRVFLFGLGILAPVYLQVLQVMAPHLDIHLFFFNPCREYWGDLLGDRARAAMRARWRQTGRQDMSHYYFGGNPLLASLGVQGREFFEALTELELVEEAIFRPPSRHSLLATVQADILELIRRPEPDHPRLVLDDGDRSIRLHVCHSRLREVQVLHDRLLDLLADLPGLTPRDIIVMAPDIEEYTEAVTGVFSAARGDTFIPWSLADRSPGNEQQLIAAFLALLEAADSRHELSAVLALLEVPAIHRRCGLDGEGLSRVRSWIHANNIRWGLDREQRRQLCGRDSGRHSWEFGLERMLLGYCLDSEELYRDIAPFPYINGQEAEWLGSLAGFIDRLRRCRRLLRQAHPAERWSRLLLDMLDDFFQAEPGGEDDESLALLRSLIVEFGEYVSKTAPGEEITTVVILEHLRGALRRQGSGQAFLGGGVTFCNMVPMRAIPFRVIWLLGMNDTDYPRVSPAASFDLINRHPRRGDRRRRDDDRYLFLEALLSARDVFSISWVGRDIRDNSRRQPSGVVGELCDYLDTAFDAGEKSASAAITSHYPLQPFSPRCFDGTGGYRSYAVHWLPKREKESRRQPFLPQPLPAPEPVTEVEPADLVDFWKHPVRFFLQRRLGVYLRKGEELPPDSEPFALDPLSRYRLGNELVQAALDGGKGDMLRLLRARGDLPHRELGDATFDELAAAANRLAARVKPLLGPPRDPFPCRLRLECCDIVGSLDNLFESGRVTYRFAKVKTVDFLSLWIHHLVLALAAPPGVECCSVHVGSDRLLRFGPVAAAGQYLNRLLELRFLGLRQPLHFYPRTSMEWVTARPSRRNTAARKSWLGKYRMRGEGEAEEYELVLAGCDPLDDSFRELAEEICGPLLDHLEA